MSRFKLGGSLARYTTPAALCYYLRSCILRFCVPLGSTSPISTESPCRGRFSSSLKLRTLVGFVGRRNLVGLVGDTLRQYGAPVSDDSVDRRDVI